MIRATFKKLRGLAGELFQLQENVGDAFDDLAKQIPRETAPQLVSFVVTGLNGTGTIFLTPVKALDGHILRRAATGMRLVAVVNLTDDTDAQGLFAQTIAVPDQIQQLTTTNLSAKKLLVVLVR